MDGRGALGAEVKPEVETNAEVTPGASGTDGTDRDPGRGIWPWVGVVVAGISGASATSGRTADIANGSSLPIPFKKSGPGAYPEGPRGSTPAGNGKEAPKPSSSKLNGAPERAKLNVSLP